MSVERTGVQNRTGPPPFVPHQDREDYHQMKLFDAFRYDGKRVLVVGGASGMGAATAQNPP